MAPASFSVPGRTDAVAVANSKRMQPGQKAASREDIGEPHACARLSQWAPRRPATSRSARWPCVAPAPPACDRLTRTNRVGSSACSRMSNGRCPVPERSGEHSMVACRKAEAVRLYPPTRTTSMREYPWPRTQITPSAPRCIHARGSFPADLVARSSPVHQGLPRPPCRR
jgi:hypothetical protein